MVCLLHRKIKNQNTMADNYLGKQYEDYEARKAAWEKAKKCGKTRHTTNKSRKKKKDQKSNLE